jgi:hypothetical protein
MPLDALVPHGMLRSPWQATPRSREVSRRNTQEKSRDASRSVEGSVKSAESALLDSCEDYRLPRGIKLTYTSKFDARLVQPC